MSSTLTFPFVCVIQQPYGHNMLHELCITMSPPYTTFPKQEGALNPFTVLVIANAFL